MKSYVGSGLQIVVAAVVLAACASTNGDGFKSWIDVETVDGGKRLRVDGVFEVTAPIAVCTDGGIVFESVSSRRDVVITDWLEPDSDDPRVKDVRGEGSMSFSSKDLEEMSRNAPWSRNKSESAEEGGKPQIRPWRANHVRVRTDGHGRYLLDAIDLSDGSETRFDSTYSTHVEYDVSER